MAINKRKVLEAARKYAQKGAQAKALKEFDKLLKADPRDARLRLEVGDAHRRWGNADKAIETYKQVAEQYTKEGFDARAVAVYKQIHNLKPDAYESYAPLAELYQRMGLDSEAIVALQTAADGYHKQGKKAEALDLLRKMAMLDPTNTTSRIKVADLLRQEGLTDEAVAEYEETARELERQGDIEAASGVYERILEVEPDRRETLVKLAEKLVERGLVDRAEPYVKRVLEAEPDEPARYELMATVYRLQERDDELADTYRKLAELYRRRGDDDQAREILQRYVPTAEFEQVEIGIDEQTAFGALDSVVSLDDARVHTDESGPEAELQLGSLSESAPLESPIFDPDGSAHLEVEGFGAMEEGEDDGEFLALDSDSEPVDLELDQPLELDTPAAPSAAAAPPSESDVDVEQLLAEASVYLRYGKREQAIENLQAIVSSDPTHRVALEKLGEAHMDGGDEPLAISVWLQAAEAARAQGEFDAVAELRDRIAVVDPEAANSLGPPPPKPAAPEAAPEVEPTAVNLDAVEAAQPEDPNELSREIDLDDIEIDIEDSEFAEEIPTPGAGDDEEEEAPVAAESSEVAADSDAEAAPADAAPAAVSEGADPGASNSAASVQQIAEDLEEADFYMKQGLAEEAEAIYRRVLEVAPNHPLALVRLGEVAALRGDDPASSHPGVAVEAAAEPVEDAPAEETPPPSFRDDIPGPDEGGFAEPERSSAFEAEEVEADAPETSVEASSAAPPTDAVASAEVDLDVDVEVEFDVDAEEADEREAAASDDGESVDDSESVDDGDAVDRAAESEPALASEASSTDAGVAGADAHADADAAGAGPSEVEEELASQFLSEVTEPVGLDLDPASDTDTRDEPAADASTVDPDDTAGVGPTAVAKGAASEAAISDAAEVPSADGGAPEGLDVGVDDDTPETPIDDAAEAAPDLVSPDDSYTDSGVPLGESPELALPEDADDSTESDAEGADFDLAAELSDVFDDEDGNSASGLGDSGDGFEAVFREFKRGVSLTLSENDHEAHFDLGIAYREMGLFEDAKNEFRAAMLHPEREIECRHMLGLCCLEQESPAEAVGEFERIVAFESATDEQRLSARFELGRAFAAMGEKERARTAFEAVAAVDPAFCDVRDHLEALDAPESASSPSLETFDDLIADVESGDEESGGAATADLETFDDLMSDDPGEPEVAEAEVVEPEAEVEEVDEPPSPEPTAPRKRKKISFV